MRLIPAFFIALVFLCNETNQSQALDCTPHPIDVLDESKPGFDQAVASTLFKLTHWLEDRWFIVYGTFEKREELPLIHELDLKARRNLHGATGSSNLSLDAHIEYTYLRQFSFSGRRLLNGKDESFETSHTRLTVTIEGDIFGSAPPFNIPVVGVMREHIPDLYDIDPGICSGYRPITERQFQLFRKCLKQDGCP